MDTIPRWWCKWGCLPPRMTGGAGHAAPKRRFNAALWFCSFVKNIIVGSVPSTTALRLLRLSKTDTFMVSVRSTTALRLCSPTTNPRSRSGTLQIILGLLRLWQQRGAGHRNLALKKKGMQCFKDFTRRQLRVRIPELFFFFFSFSHFFLPSSGLSRGHGYLTLFAERAVSAYPLPVDFFFSFFFFSLAFFFAITTR